MNNAAIVRRAPLVSYLLFAGVILAFVAYPVANGLSHGPAAGVSFAVLFAVGCVWQLFTVYYHGQRALQWLLLCIYVSGLGFFLYSVLA